MKKLLTILLLLLFNFSLFSIEQVLIDFSNLSDTTVDFSEAAGDFWSAEKKALMRLDLSPQNWRARVNSSSFNNMARERTYTLNVKNSQQYPGLSLLGVRAYFPQRHANSYVEILPPFEIPAFYENTNRVTGKGDMFHNKGVVTNVGILKSIGVNILGNNFKYAFYVRIKNHRNEVRDVFLGFLNFRGWQQRVWLNPNYDNEKLYREEKRGDMPYYPSESPYVKLMGFVIHRADPAATGNFVTMIKEITVDFDEHYINVPRTEYLQEEIFKIYNEELIDRSLQEIAIVNRRIFMEWQENQIMDSSN